GERRPELCLPIDDQILGVAQLDSVIQSKLLRAISGDQHVLAFLENGARQTNGVAYMFNGNGCAGLERDAIHENGIELNFTVSIEMGTNAGMEHWFVFQFNDRLLAGVESGAAGFENRPTSIEGSFNSRPARGFEIRGNIPGSAMNG